jgi:hypothetical protein
MVGGIGAPFNEFTNADWPAGESDSGSESSSVLARLRDSSTIDSYLVAGLSEVKSGYFLAVGATEVPFEHNSRCMR